ncbi:MAG: DUF418 domain-containing protein [Pseudomonadota bacterium]
MNPATTATGIETPRRINDLDVLRGFALLGILVVNIGAFASGYYGAGLADPAFDVPLDRFMLGLVRTLFETKFYLLFSFLFGYSFTLQMASAQRAQQAFVPRYLRRSAGLLLLGIGHAVLFFHGDILVTYALLGLVLLGMRGLAPRPAIQLAVSLVAATALGWALVGMLLMGEDGRLPVQEIHDDVARATAAYRGSIGTTITQHIRELHGSVWLVLALVQAPCAFAMFLLGLAAAKSEYFNKLADKRRQLWKMLLIGAPIGLAGALCYSHLNATPSQIGQSLLGLAIGIFTAPALSSAYVAALLLVLQRPQGAPLAAWLAPAGRMALTNYLMQSLVCAVLFTAWGWGLIGRLAPLTVSMIAVAIYLVQLCWSRWWLRSHIYGPVEWLLRAVTHWHWPQWKKEPPMAYPS